LEDEGIHTPISPLIFDAQEFLNQKANLISEEINQSIIEMFKLKNSLF